MSDVGTTLGVKAETAADLPGPDVASWQDVRAALPSAVQPRDLPGDVIARSPAAALALAYTEAAAARREGQLSTGERSLREAAADDEATHAGQDSANPVQIFAAYGLTPQTPRVDSREQRRREEQRRRREPEQREEIEPQEKPGYTIDDIVQFADVTVAERRTPPSRLAALYED